MKTRKRYVRAGAACLAALLTVQGMTLPVEAGEEVKVRSNSQTQMSSDPEAVYVSNYGKSTDQRTINFDSNWKFNLGDVENAQTANFDDSKWRQVSLPHDYSIEQDYSKSMEAESGYLPGGTGWYRKSFTIDKAAEGKEIRVDFSGVYMNASVWVNGEKLGTHPYGYTPFSFDITDYVKYGEENTIAVKVENKTPSSRWYSGSGIYRSVNLTMTEKVHVDLEGTQITTENLKAEQGGTVNMDVRTQVVNDSEDEQAVTLTHTVFPKGADESAAIGTVTTEAKTVASGESDEIEITLEAQSPALWSVDSPTLYTVRTEVKLGENTVDVYDTEYGFRYFDFDNNTGFSLNGQNTKLKGVCMHHDQGALGAKANARAIARQIEILKQMGCNAIRVTHNPAADELIQTCNEQGMLVIDEAFDTWLYAKNGNSNDYAKWFNQTIDGDNQILGAGDGMTWAQFDLTAMVKRGYNAPSIIMWSLGNEVMEGISGGVSNYPATAQKLVNWVKELDATRPMTTGDNKLKANWSEAESIGNTLNAAGGTVGFNYCAGWQYDNWHKLHPEWLMYGSETASAINSRGIYNRINGGSQTSDKQLTSYDNSAVGWGSVASDAWYTTITRDYLAGEYVWTGFDYIGEPTPWNGTGAGSVGSWPAPKSSYFGIVDTAGFAKDSYYFYQSQWNDQVHTLHVLPAWNENVVYKDNSGKVPVVVYSDAASVELFFTPAGGERQSLGKKAFTQKTTAAGYTYQIYEGEDKNGTEHKNLYLTWKVPYADGTLEAVAYDADGNIIENTDGRSSVTTTGEAAKLQMSADRTEIAADGKDLSYVTVDVTDQNGNIVPDAENRVTFNVEGDGVLVGVDNGSSPDHDSYLADNRKAFSGKVLAIVQSTKTGGSFTVTATADGLESAAATVTTYSVSDGTPEEKEIDSFWMSKTYYVKTGNIPVFPTTIETRYTDGSKESKAVTWDAIGEEMVQQSGNFNVQGQIEGHQVTVNVNVIDEVGGLLNYSTSTPVGTVPILPESRPAVLTDGTILTASFGVNWDDISADQFAEEGTVTVNGTADVLGDEIPVSATIRVQTEQITVGSSVSGKVMNLTQSIPEGEQSDTLSAIVDGSTTISDNTSGGANPTAWSNWQSSQNGNSKAEITFEYATQQRLGQIVMHFAKDSGSMRYPDAGTTEILVSEDGTNWNKLAVTETIGEESGRVKPYTYDFTPTTATFIKFKLTNASAPTGTRWKPCTALTEIELKVAQGSFVSNTTAKLEEVIVNGNPVPESALAQGSYSTPAIFAEVEAKAADNASVTILPTFNNIKKIIVESEDHNTRNVFEIRLGEETEETPESGDRDYPIGRITAFAESEYNGSGTEGPAEYVLDEDEGTHWHTNWRTNEAQDVEKRWIGLELEEPAVLDAFRYYPRGGNMNGFVSEYKVQYKLNQKDEWTDIAGGTWDRTLEWKIAEFDEPVEAKYVRLVGIHTYAKSENDAHMAVAELRVREADKRVDISAEDSQITVSVPEQTEVAKADEQNPVYPQVEVKRTVNGVEETLRYGVDYLLSYENNTAFGTGKVIVTGIVNYRGVVERTFEIVKKAPELSAVYIQSQPGKTVYKSGETFDPTGLSLKLVYDDDSEEELVYSEETAGQFGFEPGLDTALTEEVKEITVAYGGKSAVVFIGVESSETPGPEKPDPENPTPGKPNPEKPNPEDPKPGNGSGSENNGGTGSGSGSNSNNGSSGGNNTVNNIINNNNNNNSNSSNKNSGKVQTGDRNNLVFPLIGMTAAILAIATVLIIRKKKRL